MCLSRMAAGWARRYAPGSHNGETSMQALVLERAHELRLRDIDLPEALGPGDVRIAIHTVGICGSDLHYYEHGAIGPFVVRAPMVLGHEASGTVIARGNAVTHLAVGDRVCMEPGIPDWTSLPARLGFYNLDPSVVFWATPPVHGCLTAAVTHPANLTFKLPDAVSFAEGAFVEPLAVAMQAAGKARILPGQVAAVLGAGTIGLMTALAALAAGCARVIVTDIAAPKLAIARGYAGIETIDASRADVPAEIRRLTGGWGADVVFEASGSARVFAGICEAACPGGAIVLVGMPAGPVPMDVVAAQLRELRIEHVFRYAHVFPRAIALMASGKIDLKPLVSRTYPFSEAVAAFEYAAAMHPDVVKVQIAVAA
jgi:D-xylulose reductase